MSNDAQSNEPGNQRQPPKISLRLTEQLRQQELAAKQALESLISSHPAKEINEDLKTLISSKRIRVSISNVGGGSAASVGWEKTPKRGIELVLTTPVNFLLTTKTSTRWKQLVLYHEYQHILQKIDDTSPNRADRRRFVVRKLRDSF